MRILHVLFVVCIGALVMIPQTHAYSVDSVQNEVKAGNVIVYFYTPTCPFCHYMTPIINTIQSKLDSSVRLIKIDISSNKEGYKKAFGFSTVPTVVYYKDGNKVSSHGSDNRGMTAPKMASRINSTYNTTITC